MKGIVPVTAFLNVLATPFINGSILFAGLALSVLAMAFLHRVQRPVLRSISTVSVIVGAILVICSAAPFSWWAYFVWLLLLSVAGRLSSRRGMLRRLSLCVLAIASFALAIYELPFHRTPQISTAGCDAFFVIGDSLSMGADYPEKNWPEHLGDMIGMPVKNYSFGGAMLDSALHNVKRIDGDKALVILEIGGNDLLASRDDFEENLQRLLAEACTAGRRVAMIELPLPPFFNAYGKAQRKLARAHGVILIPKRFLTAALTAPGATVDGLHFSNAGHKRLAEILRPLIVVN